MNKYNQPYLEKYKGHSSRHRCPACGDEHSFAYYLDGNTGDIIDKNVGRCNHESGCGYHYTPKQFFIDNPEVKEHRTYQAQIKPTQPTKQEIGSIPFQYVEKSLSYNSDFVRFLCSLFDRNTIDSPTIERIMNNYALGATKDGCVIYWQIDITGKVRTGKVMKYNPNTGHRIKDAGGINWIHAVMKKKKLLSNSYNLKQCLFGEHLLRIYPKHPVAIVESEKSAVIASAVYDSHIWLATGGKSQMSIDKLNVLSGRDVTMFPDADGFHEWQKKAKELEKYGLCFKTSDILEKNATKEEKAAKIDIADWIINQLSKVDSHESIVASQRDMICYFVNINPLFKSLVDGFSLIPVDA